MYSTAQQRYSCLYVVNSSKSASLDLHRLRALRYSVVVSTPDFESGNPGSNPGTAIHIEKFPFYFCAMALLY